VHARAYVTTRQPLELLPRLLARHHRPIPSECIGTHCVAKP
jgi:hypothetical protein